MIEGIRAFSPPYPPAPAAGPAPEAVAAPTDRVDLAGAASAPSGPQGGAPTSGPHAVEVVKRVSSQRWGWIELLRDRDPHFVQRNFHPRQVIRDREISAAFGTTTPHSGDALLLYAGDPPPGAPKRDVPVVLVHGASKNAQFWWDPHENGSDHGLPQLLREQGYHVYAISFAHNQDDNLLWAQQLANAVDRVKTVEGASQVDLVGHSKGGLPTRAYLSSFGEPWMTTYQGDVRRAVFVAAPLGGIDYSFRHPSANLALYGNSDDPRLNAPISWDRMIAYGFWHDVKDVGFGSDGPDYWPGQRQMLRPWDATYGTSSAEPDVRATYEGGRGYISQSRGIQQFIHESGDFMPRLMETPIDPKVEVAILAGNRPNVPGINNEKDGPSDGLLFLLSALDAPRGSKLVAQKVFPLHHKAVVSEPAPQQWIADVLAPNALPAMNPAEVEKIRKEALAKGERLVAEEADFEVKASATEKSVLHAAPQAFYTEGLA